VTSTSQKEKRRADFGNGRRFPLGSPFFFSFHVICALSEHAFAHFTSFCLILFFFVFLRYYFHLLAEVGAKKKKRKEEFCAHEALSTQTKAQKPTSASPHKRSTINPHSNPKFPHVYTHTHICIDLCERGGVRRLRRRREPIRKNREKKKTLT
jgi:hypothetical protein